MTNKQKQLLLHLGLFLVTFVTTTLAGAEWIFSKFLFWMPEEHRMDWHDFVSSLSFSVPFLLILTFHEFGHYLTARYYKIKVTLPYYIPMWLGFVLLPSIGTMGAFIKIKDSIHSLKHYFDIGISGPLAGFIVAIGVIAYGYSHLPAPEQIFEIHPEYEAFGLDYPEHVYGYDFARQMDSLSYAKSRTADSVAFYQTNVDGAWYYKPFVPQPTYTSMYFGKPLLYLLIENYLISEEVMVPHKEEIMHNPFLLAGMLALFFTALNLLPVGQLDGGHITFGMFGVKSHRIISRVMFTALLFYAGLGLITIRDLPDVGLESSIQFLLMILAYVYFLFVSSRSMFDEKRNRWLFATFIFTSQFLLSSYLDIEGYSGWLVFGLLLGRILGVDHPPVLDQTPLDVRRKILGWIALAIFVLSFSPELLVIEMVAP